MGRSDFDLNNTLNHGSSIRRKIIAQSKRADVRSSAGEASGELLSGVAIKMTIHQVKQSHRNSIGDVLTDNCRGFSNIILSLRFFISFFQNSLFWNFYNYTLFCIFLNFSFPFPFNGWLVAEVKSDGNRWMVSAFTVNCTISSQVIHQDIWFIF